MKIIFFGLGQIGKRHLKLLQKHFDFDIYAYRSGQGHARYESFDNVTEIHNWQEVDKIKPDVAFITNPTYLHMQTALQCARRGIKLFIEKPIGHNLELLNDLLLTCKHLTTYIAYPLRHIPAITDLIKKIATERIYHAQFVCRSYLPEWRYYSTYSTYKNQGGGAILDLSHEIDLATFLCGNIERITGIFGKKSDVTYDAEDYADIIIEHEYGITSNIHLDLFSKLQLRWFELSTDQQRSYIINLYGDIHHYDKTSNMVASDIYLKQLQYFFNNINDNRMMNNIHDASDMFRKVIEWKEDQYEQSN